MSPLFSSTIFDPDAISVLLRVHLCTVVDSMRRKPCVRNCSRKREIVQESGIEGQRSTEYCPRREDTKKSRNGILIGQCAQFPIHPRAQIDAPARLETHRYDVYLH